MKTTNIKAIFVPTLALTLITCSLNSTAQNERQVLSAREKKFWNAPSTSSPYHAHLSSEEKMAGLAKLWSEVKFNFVNFDLVPNLDWDSLYMAYQPKVADTKNTEAYYTILTEMVAKLRDGHTNVYAPTQLHNQIYARPALRTRFIGNKVIVVDIWDTMLLEKGIKIGSELIEINGMETKAYAKTKIEPYLSASTPQDLNVRTYEYSLLAGKLEEPIKAVFINENGKKINSHIKRISIEENAKHTLAPFEFKWLKDSIALITLNSFANPSVADEFIKQFANFAKAKAIVLDVRNNGGGNGGTAMRILSCLTNKSYISGTFYTREYRPAFRAWGLAEGRYQSTETREPDSLRHYQGPVCLLVGPKTFSAAEDFVVAFDVMKRGMIIGRPTGGSTGQPLFINLPGGGTARICTKRNTYPDGKAFIAVGVQPQLMVEESVEDIRLGRDATLAAALAQMEKNQ